MIMVSIEIYLIIAVILQNAVNEKKKNSQNMANRERGENRLYLERF